jgi:hypothetical protein
MSSVGREKAEEFFRQLEDAFSGSKEQAREITEELRADFDEHLKRFEGEGKSEDEAIELSLAEMGNPYELGHKMGQEVPPFAGKAATIIRYLLSVGVIAWLLFFLWVMRAWDYGFQSFPYALFGSLHLPVILLLWPRIIWKKNWMFTMSIATAAAFVLASVGFLGKESEQEVSYVLLEAAAPALEGPVDIKGVVMSNDGLPVEGARLSWEEGPLRTWAYSDTEGSFELLGLPEGEQPVGVTCDQGAKEWFYVKGGGELTTLELALSHVEAMPDANTVALEAEGIGEPNRFKRQAYLVSGVTGIFLLGLVFSMQQNRQRGQLFLACAVAFAVIEIPYQVEEHLFQRDMETLHNFSQEQIEAGTPFSWEELDYVSLGSDECPDDLKELELWNDRVRFYSYGSEAFGAWWPRPLSSGHSIGYDSSDGRIYVQD